MSDIPPRPPTPNLTEQIDEHTCPIQGRRDGYGGQIPRAGRRAFEDGTEFGMFLTGHGFLADSRSNSFPHLSLGLDMKHFHGVLLRSVDDQRAGGDNDLVDPTLVDISDLPCLSWNFRHDLPSAGKVTRVWLEDGQLLLEGELDDEPIKAGHLTPAVGITFYSNRVSLKDVGMVHLNRDAGLPPVVLEDE